MLFGVNLISPSTLPMIRQLIDLGKVDFCEIMLDNFVHLPSYAILSALPDIPIAIHIVASRFLEKPFDEVKSLANHLRPWIKDLNPLYVSDHLVSFTSPGGRRLSFIAELDYESVYDEVKERINYWQDWLNTRLLFENHASLTSCGSKQVSFFEKLLKETDAQLLFDFSNAYIAEYNRAIGRDAWENLIKRSKHFHVAGFKQDKTSGLLLDTHDELIDKNVLNDMQKYLFADRQNKNKTLTIEFDVRKVSAEIWQEEMLRIKQQISSPLNHLLTNNSIEAPLLFTRQAKKLDNITYQNLYHRVFHLTEKLLICLGEHDHAFLSEFLEWSYQNELSMNWTMHLNLLTWLTQQRRWMQAIKENDRDVVKELLMASVIHWSLSGLDHVNAKGIIVASPYFFPLAVGLWKNEVADSNNKIVIVRMSDQLEFKQNAYALSYVSQSWENLEWKVA